jgi:hypothetical protein|nr:MAG TPA: protein of unknown function (DUF4376) [Caudoviricetes sp.]
MFNYNDIIEYVDATWDENFNNARNWCKEHRATFDELIEKRKEVEVEKTRTVEAYENDELVVKEEKYTVVELHRYFRINKIIIPEATLEELKIAKRAEINAARDAAEQSGFEYMGKTFDSDPISCRRISCAAQAMVVMPAVIGDEQGEPTITWTCQDNTTIDLTAAELQGLVAALAQWSNSCHEKATGLKAQIENAQTAAEVEEISWSNEDEL